MKKKRKYADMLDVVADTANVEVVKDGSEAELADLVVCRALTAPLILPDNLIGKCSKCGADIQFRPHAPKRPPKMCDTCAYPIIMKHKKKGDMGVMVTTKTIDDVIRHMVKSWSN